MQPYQPNSMPALPSALSTDAIERALTGRVDQSRLKLAVEDLVRPHFYESPEERIRQVAVLVKDLAEFSDDVAGWAVREWRLKQDRKPSTATLRQLCMVRRADLTREQSRRHPQIEAAPYTLADPETQAERKATLERIAKDTGMRRDAHGQWTLPREPGDEPKRLPHWTETAQADNPLFTETLKRARVAMVSE